MLNKLYEVNEIDNNIFLLFFHKKDGYSCALEYKAKNCSEIVELTTVKKKKKTKIIKHTLKNRKYEKKLYCLWKSMIKRCYEPDNFYTQLNYQLRGITVCKEWLNNFDNFYNWAIKNGYNDYKVGVGGRNILSLDRIDNDGNYEPSNCRWATSKEQRANQRKRRKTIYNFKTILNKYAPIPFKSLSEIEQSAIKRTENCGIKI